MKSISEQLQLLKSIKEAFKAILTENNTSFDPSTPFSNYPELMKNMGSGEALALMEEFMGSKEADDALRERCRLLAVSLSELIGKTSTYTEADMDLLNQYEEEMKGLIGT